MNYILNNEIIYNSFDGSIRHLNDKPENAVSITETANKILLLLISRQGEVVSREDFFREIWDKEGLISSENTLNQYISKLRKIFSVFLPNENIITTVPRFGYVFSNDINIKKNISAEGIISEGFTLKHKYFAPLFILLLVIAILYLAGDQPVKFIPSTSRLIDHYQSCPIYEVTGIKGLKTDNVQREVVLHAIKLSNLTCESDVSFYVFMNKIKFLNKQSTVLISKCNRLSEYKNTCKNVYYTNWN